MTAVLYFALFWAYGLLAGLFGDFLTWRGGSPQFFIPLLLYLFPRTKTRHFIISAFLAGAISDALGGSPWAMHGCFFALLYLAYRKTCIFFPWDNPVFYLAANILCVYGLAYWTRLASGAAMDWHAVHIQAFLTVLFAIALSIAWKSVRSSGWFFGRRGAGASSDSGYGS